MNIDKEGLAMMIAGVGTGTLIAFIFIPLALLMDLRTGHLTNFTQMWESLGVVAIMAFLLTSILLSMKSKPEYFRR